MVQFTLRKTRICKLQRQVWQHSRLLVDAFSQNWLQPATSTDKRPCPATSRVTWPMTQFVADTRVRQLRSADTRTLVVTRHAAVLEIRPSLPQDHKSAAQSETMWAVIRPVQAVTEDIFMRTVRPRRSVNCF